MPPDAQSADPPPRATSRKRWFELLVVLMCLSVTATLATLSLLGDSLTFDETFHLTAGMSHLALGDFRLVPETPPLAQMALALPLLCYHPVWPSPQAPEWRESAVLPLGRIWLSQLNDGERMLPAARGMAVLLLLGTCLSTYAIGRRLFGSAAGLLALILAALDPTLLAHGHLATIDVPATLCFLLTLLTFARLMERLTWGRLLAAATAIAALALVKFSWPLILPSLAIMAAIAVYRTAPLDCAALSPLHRLVRRSAAGSVSLTGRPRRVAAVGGAAVFTVIVGWLAIWTCYGWRESPFRPEDQGQAVLTVLPNPGAPPPTTMAGAWETVLCDGSGQPNLGLTTTFVRWAHAHHVLPEAYLYGAAFALKFSNASRPKYLLGEVSTTGWLSYFPIAFALKTPLATLALLAAGLAALALRRAPRPRDPVLLAGLLSFSAVYAAVSIDSRFNIGIRHIVPVYPAVMILAGVAATWGSSRLGRGLVALAVVWLAGATLWVHPHYLSYFNELIGGPARGHLYLADSNLDWGQDLKRLAAYAQRHPTEAIKLAYFGSADPTHYGFACRSLPSFLPFGKPADLDAGTYVVSANQLLGIYEPSATDAFWSPQQVEEYRALTRVEAAGRAARRNAEEYYQFLRRGRLLNQLQRRPPDERIGYSLFVYRLTQPDLDALLRP